MTLIKKLIGAEEKSPGVFGEGAYYYIEVGSPKDYKRFRARKVGDRSGIECVCGQRANGDWETVKWMVSKKMAHVENGKLIADDVDAIELFSELGSVPKQIRGDRFEAKGQTKAKET